MSNDYDNEDGQSGPAVWGDESGPVPPALRTFRVVVEQADVWNPKEVYVDAHSVTCLDDAAHFYVYRPTPTAEGTVLAAYAIRTLRPYLDVEDVSGVMAVTSDKMN